MNVVAINVQIPEEVDRYFRELAESRLTSKSAVIRQILAQHVQQQEATNGNKRTRAGNRNPVH